MSGATLKDVVASFGGQRSGDAPISGMRGKLPRSRGPSLNEESKKAPSSWKRERTEVTDLVSPVHLHRVTGEGHGVGDLLHAVPKKREQHRERNARRRQIMQRVGNKPIKLGMRKPTHLVLQRNGEDHREDSHEQDREWRTEPSRPGEGRGSKDDQNKRRAFDVHRAERVGKKHPVISQPTQSLEQPPRSRIIFAVEGVVGYRWKEQDSDGTYPLLAPLEERSLQRKMDTTGGGQRSRT